MPKEVQKWGILSILGTIFAAGIIGTGSLIVGWASTVPALETTIGHLSKNIATSSSVQKQLSSEIKEFKESNQESRASVEKMIAIHNYQIQELLTDCRANARAINDCKNNHSKPFSIHKFHKEDRK